MVHERRGPGQSLVRAPGHDNVVEVRVRALLEPTLTRRVNDEHGVRGRIRDDRALVVVERGHPGEAVVARNRVADPGPGEPIVIRSLYVNQRARAAVVVRNVDSGTV